MHIIYTFVRLTMQQDFVGYNLPGFEEYAAALQAGGFAPTHFVSPDYLTLTVDYNIGDRIDSYNAILAANHDFLLLDRARREEMGITLIKEVIEP